MKNPFPDPGPVPDPVPGEKPWVDQRLDMTDSYHVAYGGLRRSLRLLMATSGIVTSAADSDRRILGLLEQRLEAIEGLKAACLEAHGILTQSTDMSTSEHEESPYHFLYEALKNAGVDVT